MARFTPVLLLLLIASALAMVTAQYKARKLYMRLQHAQEAAQQMDVEWGQLQLEQSTWAVPARVERIAATSLAMAKPRENQIKYVRPRQGLP
jgi:cell division protein FtsL